MYISDNTPRVVKRKTRRAITPVFSFTVKYCWASSLMSDIGVVCTVEPVILCTAIVALLIL